MCVLGTFINPLQGPSSEGSSITYFITRAPLLSESLYRRYPNHSNTQWKPRFVIMPVNWSGLEVYAIIVTPPQKHSHDGGGAYA